MQGIRTSKYGPYRIQARCSAKTIVVDRDDSLRYEDQHRAAAKKLATELGWEGLWHGASVPGVEGMVWVMDDTTNPNKFFRVPKPVSPRSIDPSEGEGT